jgi:hypothetical protein
MNDMEDDTEMLTEAPVQPVGGDTLLRDSNTGVFYRGTKPVGSPSGSKGGEPYWEVR